MQAKYGLPAAGGAVVVSVAYGEGLYAAPDWAGPFLGPPLAIARFARANWYAELRGRLMEAAAATRRALRGTGLDPGPARHWRCLANSGLPEKPLALAAGLGRLGRNGLVILGARGGPGMAPDLARADVIGPGAVLGLLVLPLPIDPSLETGPNRPSSAACRAAPVPAAHSAAFPGSGPCGSCDRCVRACPTAALVLDGPVSDPRPVFRRERCLQHWSTQEAGLPPIVEAAWGNRLYGCDACLEACPWFRPDGTAATSVGLLGPSLPSGFFADSPDEAIRARLRGTALGLGWMPPAAFRRNAILARAAWEAGADRI